MTPGSVLRASGGIAFKPGTLCDFRSLIAFNISNMTSWSLQIIKLQLSK